MKFLITVIISSLFIAAAAKAEEGVSQKDLIVSLPNAKSSGCNLASAGIKDKQKFLDFFRNLQDAVKNEDADKLSDMVNYPIWCGVKKTKRGMARKPLKTTGDFKKHFSKVMNDKITTIIMAQKVEDLFCNYQGVMFGNGEFWLGVNSDGKLGIKAINN